MFHTPSGSCIDIVLTNNPKNFHDTGEIETGVNDHDLHISFLKNLLGFSGPKTFWSVVTQDIFVK